MVKWFKENDMLLRLFALLIAILMWMFVMNEENPDYSKNYSDISVQIEGLEQLNANGLTIVSGGNTAIKVKVKGKRDRMTLVSSDKIQAKLSVASITEPGTYNLNYTVQVDVYDVTVATKDPEQVTVEIARLTTKSIPVSVELEGELGEGLSTAGVTATPDAISVKGPEQVVDQIKRAQVKLDLSGVTDSVSTSLSYTFQDANGETVQDDDLTVDTPSVQLEIPLLMTKEVPVTVNFYSSDYLSEDLTEVTINPTTIKVQGDPDTVRSFNQMTVGSISLRNAVEIGKYDYTFGLTLPNGLTFAENPQESAAVHIAVPGYQSTTFRVDQTAFGTQTGFTYQNQTLNLAVFGPEAAVSKLEETDFVFTPSYTAGSLKKGENVLLMKVSCKDASVKVLGTYTVKVTVAKR